MTGNNVLLVDTKTGKRVATTHIDDPEASLSVDAAVGRVYVVGYTSSGCTNNVCTEYGGSLSTLDAGTGRLLHTVHLKKVAPGNIAVDPASHRLIMVNNGFPSGRTGISLYDTRTGRRVQQVKLPARSSAYLQRRGWVGKLAPSG